VAPLPEIDGAACVHALSPRGSCRACVDACPLGAWLLDEEGLSLDTARCDGCALCVPACPRDAIALPRTITILHDAHGQGAAFAACERAGQTTAPVMPCVHAIGHRDLDALADQDIARLTILTGSCETCHRHHRVRLQTAVEAHRTVRASAGRPGVATKWCEPRDFLRAYGRALEDHDRVDRSRRRIFGSLLNSRHTPRPSQLPPLAYHVPSIDPVRCVACDACVRICPDGALMQDTDPPTYRIEPSACTGCRLCVDVCDQSAMTVSQMGDAAKKTGALDLCRCRSCGAPYNAVAGKVSQGGDLCRICARTPHHKKLFQVFKD
jgi:ferredoxin